MRISDPTLLPIFHDGAVASFSELRYNLFCPLGAADVRRTTMSLVRWDVFFTPVDERALIGRICLAPRRRAIAVYIRHAGKR